MEIDLPPDLLAEIARSPGLDDLVRLDCAQHVLDLDRDRGIELFTALARDTTLESADRGIAQYEVADQAGGIELLSEMARDVNLEFRIRMEAADTLADLDRDLCVLLLTEMSHDSALDADNRRAAADYVKELGREVRGMRQVRVQLTGNPGQDRYPGKVIGHDGLAWTVDEVLERWERPGGADAAGPGGETVRWRLRVTGPLPGHPERQGPQEVVLTSHGDLRTGWWMAPASAALPVGETRRLGSRGLSWLFSQSPQ